MVIEGHATKRRVRHGGTLVRVEAEAAASDGGIGGGEIEGVGGGAFRKRPLGGGGRERLRVPGDPKGVKPSHLLERTPSPLEGRGRAGCSSFPREALVGEGHWPEEAPPVQRHVQAGGRPPPRRGGEVMTLGWEREGGGGRLRNMGLFWDTLRVAWRRLNERVQNLLIVGGFDDQSNKNKNV